MMDNVIHHHLLVSEKKDQNQNLNVQIINLTCVLMDNVLEIKIIVKHLYLAQITNLSNVLIKHVNQIKDNVHLY